jgi:amino acid transporter
MAITETGSHSTSTQAQPVATGAGFGTFGGVFTPSILTILGVIMYLRFGWVVGQAGLGQALLVVLVAHLITLATGLSVASIATNRTVRTGGAYYIISRSLGAPTGAAIGIPLFLGQALSVTFYCVGFTETIQAFVPGVSPHLIAAVVCLFVGLLTFKGADIAIKTQYFVMAAILLSLVFMLAGRGENPPSAEEVVWWNDEGIGFGPIFAVFFPAVTGIMAGVGMSGDLKDSRKSLPAGTMAAIGVGFVVYAGLPFWFGFNATTDELINNKQVAWDIAAWAPLVYAGVWGATLSSAIGSFLTAPRTLQALAFDGLAPRVFGLGFGRNNDPRVGVAFTFVLAEAGILIGGLEAIASLLTMFFLATYGFTNIACGLEKWAANPSFRPAFKVPALVSLAGGLACFYVMSYIDLPAMVLAFVICGAIWLYAQRRDLDATWGDARHGIWSALVRTSLYRLRKAEFHPQNWRPNLLILGGGVRKHLHLLELGSAIVQDRGIVTYTHLLKGSVSERAAERIALRKELEESIAARFPTVFCRVDIAKDVYNGVVDVSQSYGVGNFESNTVMLGWPKKPERHAAYACMLRDLVQLDRSLILVRHVPSTRLGRARKLQVWWGGMQQNGGLMLLLAYLMTNHHRWRDATVQVVTVVSDPRDLEDTTGAVNLVIAQARLRAEARVLLRDDRPMAEIMAAESTGTDLAIVGMRLPETGDDKAFFERMEQMLSGLPTTLLVNSARDFQGEPLLFDEVPSTSSEAPPTPTRTSGSHEAPAESMHDGNPPPTSEDTPNPSVVIPIDEIHDELMRERENLSTELGAQTDAARETEPVGVSEAPGDDALDVVLHPIANDDTAT